MAQRTITSYFGKSAEKENVGDTQETSPAEGQKGNSTSGKRKREDKSPNKNSPGTPPIKKLEIDSPKNNAEETVKQKSKPSPVLKETTKTSPGASVKSSEEPKEEVAQKSLSEEERPRKKVKASNKKRVLQLCDSSEDEEPQSLPKKDNSGEQGDSSTQLEEADNPVLMDSSSTSDDTGEHNGVFYKRIDPTAKTVAKTAAYYIPNIENYHPIKHASWKHRERVPYAALASVFTAIEGTRARLSMISILSNYFRSVIVLSPADLLPSIYLCLNQLAPANEGIQLGVAETTLGKVIAQCTGRRLADIQGDLLHFGDLGVVAECSKAVQRTMFPPPPLTVANVYARLKDIAKMSGNAALSKKTDIIQTLYVACKCDEAKYLFRSLSGKLRIGLAEQSVVQALALACALTPPNQKYPPKTIDVNKQMSRPAFTAERERITNIFKTTYCQCPNFDKIVEVLLNDGVDRLPEKCKITPGTPIKPMLAHPTKGVQEVLTRFDNMKFTCEWKYDGERAQIHVSESGEVSIYSRNQENTTSKYPDVIGRLNDTKKESVKSCILDCEAVAWDNETKQMRPFQILCTRKRKDADESQIKVQVCIIMFDLLYLNGEALVTLPFVKRRELLKENFKEVEGTWKFATSMDTTTMEEVQDFLEESVKGSCEGLMVKTLEEEATYEIAKRSRNWLKLKKDYLEGVGDTLDLVVIGGYLGKGKRTGTYGGFLLACYDQENEEYQTLCKIGTGFSEEDLQKHTEFFKAHTVEQPKQYYRYNSIHEPDHWFEPVQVWEVKCADLSLSPVHKAAVGIVDPEKGISLRFPRFIGIREDKNCEDATSAQQVAELYNNQEQIKSEPSASKKVTEEDFY